MSRYIDAEWIESRLPIFHSGLDEHSVLELLKNAPSIDIVPCRECRKVREDGGHANCGGYLYCRKWRTLVDEDSYCSWGKRSE